MKKVTNGFESLSLAEFRQKLDLIVSSMTDNAYYPTLQTSVQALATAAAAYKDLTIAAESRDQQAILKRDAARAAITEQLHSLGKFVDAVADNDVEKLASSGYSYTQPRKATPAMAKPTPPLVGPGTNNGEINCRTIRQPGMKSVNFYITSDAAALTATDTAAWDVTTWNKVSFTFINLIGGQRYYIRVGLVGVRGQEVISDPVSYIPQ